MMNLTFEIEIHLSDRKCRHLRPKHVDQLTALKCLHQHEPEPASLPLFDDDSDFPTLDSEAVASLVSFDSSPLVKTYKETAPFTSHLRTLRKIYQESPSPVFPDKMAPTRSPLQPVDQDVVH
ncbi:unnamed protein product [Pocillopora meandrina]|uniref:Uncharacterized protein n=1 Tax=Pocillopora meandrina TaxID=46732 RepID=A0AAU9Y4S3_9CNID|nr:unnamed protein product [Pocillopora meandrina]